MKKIFPKVKKQLHGFLADESGKISKEDVLKISLATVALGGLIPSSADAVCNPATYAASHVNVPPFAGWTFAVNIPDPWWKTCYVHSNIPYQPAHNNVGSYWHDNTPEILAHNNNIADGSVWLNNHANGTIYYTPGSATASINEAVNGHLNWSWPVPVIGATTTGLNISNNIWHASHGSHGSHGSHCSSMC